MSKSIYETLAANGICGPGSTEVEKHERYLTRYFEREYKHLQQFPVSMESIGIDTSVGPMMEETDALMEHHYDERQEFFESFLDKEYLAYSMAYYGETPEEIMGSTATLEEAQRAKFELISRRAQITGNERIINIGCGFGSLETYLLSRFPNLEIVGVTPSKVQAEYLSKRMTNTNDPLGSGRFRIVFGSIDDVQDILRNNGKYNLAISIGVLEHAHNVARILQFIDSILTNNGLSFHHFITSKFVIPDFLNPSNTKIGIYFPGGKIWPHNIFMCQSINNPPIRNWFINGMNYWRTLSAWHERFWASSEQLLSSGFSNESIAHWNNYFSLCKAVFAPFNGTCYGNSQYLFSKLF